MAFNNLSDVSGPDLIVGNHYLIGTFVPFSHNVLSFYISLHKAYFPFFCPLIWPSYFLLQFILTASVCHYTESFAENFILAGSFFRSLITMLSKIDPALIPGVYTFPLKKSFPRSLPSSFPVSLYHHISIKYLLCAGNCSCVQNTFLNQTDKKSWLSQS